MIAVGDMVELIDEVGMAAVREKSVGLTEHAIALSDRCWHRWAWRSPRRGPRRSGVGT
jgi:kynureninase